MTEYQGNVHSYVLDIQSPNNPYNHKSVITLRGAFGLALLYFVPQDGQLGNLRHLLLDGFLAAFHRPAAQRKAGALPVRRF